ncbi:sensor domain-containing diguanylate cyclase [Salinicola avicenniae]|uniref:sensor domain-containing diguanylate cyclase n=1 Tax=Salinicola avicenniae TaxID=2916836 RepID=UPI0020733377|nr:MULTISPECIES: diguanylate cyclase [unclassified Salinicola]
MSGLQSFLLSLRGRFVVSLLGLLIIAMAALLLIGTLLIYPNVRSQEIASADLEMDRLERALGGEMRTLMMTSKDWAIWDDTYTFIQGHNKRYLQVNLSDSLFEDLDFQAMLFLDAHYQMHWGAGIDPDTGHYASCSMPFFTCRWMQPFLDRLWLDDNLSDDEPEAYLFSLNDRRYLAATHPVVRSNGMGPAAGWLVQIRPLNDRWHERFRQTTGRRLMLRQQPDSAPAALQVRPTGDGNAEVSRGFVSNDQTWLMSTRIPRRAFIEHLTTLHYAQWWTAGLLLVVIILIVVLLELVILRPLRQLSRFTRRARQEDFCSEVPAALLTRQDEVGGLAREFAVLIRHQRQRNHRLLELSQTDHLTGLANRRHFDAHLEHLLTAPDIPPPIAAIMIDIDDFKAYNDGYGHPEGDRCLKRLASCLDRVCTLADIDDLLLARVGGEEFAVIMPGADQQRAGDLAEQLRQGVVELHLPHAHSPRGWVTISLGVAVSTPTEHSASTLLSRADSALYSAKQAGRNRVMQEDRQPA